MQFSPTKRAWHILCFLVTSYSIVLVFTLEATSPFSRFQSSLTWFFYCVCVWRPEAKLWMSFDIIKAHLGLSLAVFLWYSPVRVKKQRSRLKHWDFWKGGSYEKNHITFYRATNLVITVSVWNLTVLEIFA